MYYTNAQIESAATALESLPTKIVSRKRQPKQSKPVKLADLKTQVNELVSCLKTIRSVKHELTSAGINADLRTRRGWLIALEYFTAYHDAIKVFRASDHFIRSEKSA